MVVQHNTEGMATIRAVNADQRSIFTIDAPDWMDNGLCAQANPEAWFPEKGGSTREAKRICRKCTVAAECLDYALSAEERFGIWGGLSERERRKLLKAMGKPMDSPNGNDRKTPLHKRPPVRRHQHLRPPRRRPRLHGLPPSSRTTLQGDPRIMTTFNPEQKLTIVKHLAGGKTPEIVATIMGANAADIVEVARHHGYPDKEKLQWAADIMTKNLDKVDQDQLAAKPVVTGGTPVRTEVAAPARVAPGTVPPTRPDELRILINTAKGHPSKRIQTAANKVIDQIDRLRTMITEDQEKNAERRRADAEKAAARAEVERLEAQLAEAKAKLRGAPKPKGATSTKASPIPRGEYPCRNDGCDKVIDTPQGRGLHERQHCEHRPEAIAS